MRVGIFGLGYVGAVAAACLSRDGHEVIGVDVNPEKVARVAQGLSPVVEPGLNALLEVGAKAGRIRATTVAAEAVRDTDMSMICVGTPPMPGGGPDLRHVYEVCGQIGAALKHDAERHVVVVRSTIPPGTLSRCEEILRNASGHDDIAIAFNPEFLREGSAVADYDHPPYTVVGTTNGRAEAALRDAYSALNVPFHVVAPAVAEMLKYVANPWHAAKIAFANEIGRIARGFGVSGEEVMALIVADTKLNISPAYMRPGFAYGGSCLPKDLSSLLYYARSMDVAVPMLESIPRSNQIQLELGLQEVLGTGAKRIAVLGLAFKPRTDDLRMSPAVSLVKLMLGEGRSIRIYDRCVHDGRLTGTNLAYIQENLPHFDELLMPTLDDAVRDAELVVVTYTDPEINEWLAAHPPPVPVLDLTRALSEGDSLEGDADTS